MRRFALLLVFLTAVSACKTTEAEVPCRDDEIRLAGDGGIWLGSPERKNPAGIIPASSLPGEDLVPDVYLGNSRAGALIFATLRAGYDPSLAKAWFVTLDRPDSPRLLEGFRVDHIVIDAEWHYAAASTSDEEATAVFDARTFRILRWFRGLPIRGDLSGATWSSFLMPGGRLGTWRLNPLVMDVHDLAPGGATKETAGEKPPPESPAPRLVGTVPVDGLAAEHMLMGVRRQLAVVLVRPQKGSPSRLKVLDAAGLAVRSEFPIASPGRIWIAPDGSRVLVDHKNRPELYRDSGFAVSLGEATLYDLRDGRVLGKFHVPRDRNRIDWGADGAPLVCGPNGPLRPEKVQ